MPDSVKQSLTADTSATKCERCNGSGMYIFQQRASEYAKKNGKDHIYGERDPLIWVGTKCPYCNGGFADNVSIAKKDAELPSAFYNKRLKDFDWDIYVDDTGKPANTLGTRKAEEAYIEKFEAAEEENKGFYIYSRTKGSGKTFLASCICNELMSNRAIRTRFVNASQLIDISQSGDKSSYDEYKRNPTKLVYECKFLVLDDLGQKNTGGEWLEDILYKLLDYRMLNKRMTMITSNIPMQELPYNERILDRINNLCVGVHLPEICVRSKEARESNKRLFDKLGLL